MLLLFAVLFTFVGNPSASAHVQWTGSSPTDQEVLTSSPQYVQLTFTGKLQAETVLHTIRIIGPEEVEVATEGLELNDSANVLMAKLPQLENGDYRVNFRVISRDGHPITGTLRFTVATSESSDTKEVLETEEHSEPVPQDSAADSQTTEQENEHQQEHQHGQGAVSASTTTALLFLSRIVYYFALLTFLGWLLWSALRIMSADEKVFWRKIGWRLQLVHLVAFLFFAIMQWTELTAGNTNVSLLALLRETSTGQSWLFTSILSLGGLLLLFQYRLVDAIWVILLATAKTWNSHASAFEPVLWTRLADGIHLVGAALWVGGILALILLAKQSNEWMHSFARTFSPAALISVVGMALTGVAITLLYTEQLQDVWLTVWGRLLLAKVLLVAVLIVIAYIVRRKWLRLAGANDSTAQLSWLRWLRVDGSFLMIIVLLTSILTHLSPLPERTMFHWHAMGETVHLTAAIDSLRNGDNELQLKIWVPEGDERPDVTAVIVESSGATVEAQLVDTEIAAEEWEYFPGFVKFTFAGAVQIVDYKQAKLSIIIQLQSGEQYTYERDLN
jgi:copper transport protein